MSQNGEYFSKIKFKPACSPEIDIITAVFGLTL